MAEADRIVTVAVADIAVPADRLRAVKPDYAGLFAAMLQKGRALPPVKVRKTPPNQKNRRKWTLVAGAHRLEGHRLAGLTGIAAQIVTADPVTAREEEIEENLFRNELTALERVDAVAEYRRLFEAAFGKIRRGNPDFSNSANLAELGNLNLLGINEDSAQGSFYARVAGRLGLSRRAGERLCAIARGLRPELRDALRNSTAEDNLTALERLSKYAPQEQAQLVRLVRESTHGNVEQAEAALFARKTPSAKQQTRDRLIDSWRRIGREDRFQALDDMYRLAPDVVEDWIARPRPKAARGGK